MSWRDVKVAHKARVHATFAIPAVYLPYAAGVALPVNVRLHNSQVNLGLPVFVTREKPPTVEDDSPKLVFDVNEVPAVASKGFVFFSNTEAYRIGTYGPVLFGYYTADCTRIPTDQIAAVVDAIKVANSGVLPAVYAGFLV